MSGFGSRSPRTPAAPPYDPEQDLRRNWPEVQVVVAPLRGTLLGRMEYPVITLRAGTTAAQRRCTLAHEIVHLERGVRDCGRWAAREELAVHAEAARRLIPAHVLDGALREVGAGDPRALAAALEVDRDTLEVRLAGLTPSERRLLGGTVRDDLWSVA